jgi:hypothetical protein
VKEMWDLKQLFQFYINIRYLSNYLKRQIYSQLSMKRTNLLRDKELERDNTNNAIYYYFIFLELIDVAWFFIYLFIFYFLFFFKV